MLTAHFDESYGDNIYLVAGYVGPVAVWTKFTDEWQAVLHTRPKIKSFHMADVAGAHGPLRGLTQAQINDKLEQFVQIVERHAEKMFGILCVTEEDALRAALPAEVFGKLYSDPYDFCIKNCIQSTRQVRDRLGLRDRVRFIFDKGPLSEPEQADIHRYVKEIESDNPKFFAGEILFEHDTDVKALQASDMLAWHLRLHSARRIEPQPGSILARLMKPEFNKSGWWSRKAIAEFLIPLLKATIAEGKIKTVEDLRRVREKLIRLQEEINEHHGG